LSNKNLRRKLRRQSFGDDRKLKTRVRDSQRTRKRILIAAAREFAKRGFDGARISEIARRARTSKQLIHHHFHGKEALFMQVHEAQFRPTVQWKETLPPHAADVIAARFRKRAANMDYLRFLTWEAASAGNTPVPGETERRQRLTEYADAIRAMQAARLMPADFDPRLTQLLILALASYPLAFTQITRLVTGRAATDPKFQRKWTSFLRKVGARLFATSARPQRGARTA